jgi:hypothetical protein
MSDRDMPLPSNLGPEGAADAAERLLGDNAPGTSAGEGTGVGGVGNSSESSATDAGSGSVATPHGWQSDESVDEIDQASMDSFPSSDPPSYTPQRA